MSTPNMSLVLPVDHGSNGTWDTILDAVFNLIDAHDHTTGKGVQVPSAGIGINADLSFASFALTAAKGIGFTETTTALVTGYSDLLFVNSADHNLYFRNNSGTNVQITSGSTLNVSIVGGIGGDYSSVGALLSFDDATKRYLLQSEGTPRPWSGLATADIDLYQKAASITNKVTLKSPSALGASYSVTYPTALPASTLAVMMSSTGQLSTLAIPLKRQVFTASGTYTPTAGTTRVLVRMVGGGGGGGGAAGSGATGHAAAGGGGGSGAYFEQFISNVSAGGSVTVGAAGAGGTAGANAGSDGGNTVVSLTVLGTPLAFTATGGKGGNGAATTANGTNAGGALNAGSSNGDVPTYQDTGGTGMSSGNGIYSHSGRGGHSQWGRGGAEVFGTGNDFQAAGVNGNGAGAGGSGGYSGCTTTSSSAVAGGNGIIGLVIIDEYA